MKQPYPALIRFKLKQLGALLRKSYYRLLGLTIYSGGSFGNVSIEWPHKIVIGYNCVVQDDVDFRISHPFDPDNSIRIGNNVFLGRCVEINCQSQVTIADNCWIASNTTIVDIYHEIKPELLIRLQPIKSSPITIEEDVWIGSHSVILSGVQIGKGSIIGAGSVVNKSIPPYQIWAGVPAKFIRNR